MKQLITLSILSLALYSCGGPSEADGERCLDQKKEIHLSKEEVKDMPKLKDYKAVKNDKGDYELSGVYEFTPIVGVTNSEIRGVFHVFKHDSSKIGAKPKPDTEANNLIAIPVKSVMKKIEEGKRKGEWACVKDNSDAWKIF